MTEATFGPETLLPPRFPPERLGPYFIEKNLVKYVPSKFVDLDGKLNKEGRRFTKELFRNLDAYFDGDFERMREEIVGSEERVLANKDFDEYEKRQYQKIFRSLRAKFNSQVGLASARVSAKERPEVSDKNFKDILRQETEAEGKRIGIERSKIKRPNPRLRKIWLIAVAATVTGVATGTFLASPFIDRGDIRAYETEEIRKPKLETVSTITTEVIKTPIVEKTATPEIIKSKRISDQDAIKYGKLTEERINGLVPADAVLAILDIESSRGTNFGKGKAMGPAQIMPDTLEDVRGKFVKIVGREPDPYSPEDATLLSALVLKEKGWKTGDQESMRVAVMRYGGFGNKQETLDAKAYWQRFSTQSQWWKNNLK